MNPWMFTWTIFLIAIILVYVFVVVRVTFGGAREIGTMLRRLDAAHKKPESTGNAKHY